MYTFEWAEDKNRANIDKHGIDFVDAALLFDGVRIEAPSSRDGEIRFRATGKIEGRFITVIYTTRGENIRIISARRARDDERRAYQDVYP